MMDFTQQDLKNRIALLEQRLETAKNRKAFVDSVKTLPGYKDFLDWVEGLTRVKSASFIDLQVIASFCASSIASSGVAAVLAYFTTAEGDIQLVEAQIEELCQMLEQLKAVDQNEV